MRRVRIFDREGRSEDERETCFPIANDRDKNRGAGIR